MFYKQLLQSPFCLGFLNLQGLHMKMQLVCPLDDLKIQWQYKKTHIF